MYIIDRLEHGNGGVYGTEILDKLPLKEALKKTPYSYGRGYKMFGFYPVICRGKDHNRPSYIWDEDTEHWKKLSWKA